MIKNTFSIIMPSYLGKYKNAASNREFKLKRAIQSVLAQTFKNWELIIIADGCNETVEIVKDYLCDKRIRLYKIPKQQMWSGKIRNTGLYHAKNKWVLYLDIDDSYNQDYLHILNKEISDEFDWFYMDEYSWNKKDKTFDVHQCNIKRKGFVGTSNIIHKRALDVWWYVQAKYAMDDWMFINLLKIKSNKYKKLKAVGYQVQHVPNLLDV